MANSLNKQTIFYSWKSDLPNSTNRGFIEGCLATAIKRLQTDDQLDVDPSLDRDTKDTPGAPDIAQTILDKIDACRIFVCDVSLINRNHSQWWSKLASRFIESRPTPNPNVLIELGYAVKSRSWNNVICVLNTTTGSIEDLPFDIRQRRCITYELHPGQQKSDVKESLAKHLERKVRKILDLSDASKTVMQLEFADLSQKSQLGTTIQRDGTWWTIDGGINSLPDYTLSSSEGAGGDLLHLYSELHKVIANKEYYRDKAHYLIVTALTQPTGLVALSPKTLTDVRLELEIDNESDVMLLSPYKLPKLPPRQFGGQDLLPQLTVPAFEEIQSSFFAGSVEIEDLGERVKMTIHFKKIQAGSKVFSDPFLIGSKKSQSLELPCKLFADELDEPQVVVLHIEFDVAEKELTLDILEAELPEEYDDQT